MDLKSNGCEVFDRQVREAKKIAAAEKRYRDLIVRDQQAETLRHPLRALASDQHLARCEKQLRQHDAAMRRLRRLTG